MRLFCEKKGAISVFLTVILLPMLIVALLANDAARIYCAKSVIADAGEMTMNAALAQYNAELKDTYGLIAMDKQPSSMQGELEKYFTASLNGNGLSSSGDYKQILDLVEQNFDAIDIEASKLYKTEVEKQQILEYMKYRAPVCIAELVLDKIDQIKETSKMMEAMTAEADFAEAMEDCQDAFEEAKKALDELKECVDMIKEYNAQQVLDDTQRYYLTDVYQAVLMYVAIDKCKSDSNNHDKNKEAQAKAGDAQQKYTIMNGVVDSFLNAIEDVNLSDPLSEASYEGYRNALYYENTLNYIGSGKVEDLLTWYDEAKASAASGEETEDEEPNTEDPERAKLVEKINKYTTKRDTLFSPYQQKVYGVAEDIVNFYSGKLGDIYTSALTGEEAAKTAYKKLEEVEKKLKDAAEKHAIWKEKTEALSNPGNMQKEVEEYGHMFNTEKCDKLMEKVKHNQESFKNIKEAVKAEKFFNQSIEEVEVAAQLRAYIKGAKEEIGRLTEYSYGTIDGLRNDTGKNHYDHVSISDMFYSIEDDEFYKELVEYCENNESADKEEKKKEANEKLEDGAKGSEEAKKDDEQLQFDWSSVQMTLPSRLLRVSSYGTVDSDKLTNTSGGDIDSKRERRNIIKRVKESITEASNFLDAVSGIMEKGLENLYIAEYGMQMFTYYTVDKRVNDQHKIDTLEGDDLTSLSGYKFNTDNDKAYKAETEYILWGKSTSKQNVQTTIALIYGIRLLFNSFFAFTDEGINKQADIIAAPWSAIKPYLRPIIKMVFKFGLALCESTDDIKDIKEGYGVAIVKDPDTWASGFTKGTSGGLGIGNVNTGGKFTFDYSEYLRVFLNVRMLADYTPVLARIGDCIQVNTGADTDITKMYTMLSVQATVTNRTTFMRKIADWSGAGWQYGDRYSIEYKSVLGY